MNLPINYVAFTVGLLAVVACVIASAPSTQPTRKTRIVLVGDSTVTDKDGWGGGFAQLVGPDIEVVNESAGGRSSKSYRAEGKWDKALAKKGDYMLIQFGHNDQPGKGPDRETDAATTFKDNMVRYAKEAQAAGFKPILVTSLVRRKFNPLTGHIKSDLTDYVDGTKAAAKEAGVPLIDLHARSIEYFDTLGKAACDAGNPRDPKDGNADTTHLSEPWHKPVAKLVIQELAKVESELGPKLAETTK